MPRSSSSSPPHSSSSVSAAAALIRLFNTLSDLTADAEARGSKDVDNLVKKKKKEKRGKKEVGEERLPTQLATYHSVRVCSPEPCQVSWHNQRHLTADDEQREEVRVKAGSRWERDTRENEEEEEEEKREGGRGPQGGQILKFEREKGGKR